MELGKKLGESPPIGLQYLKTLKSIKLVGKGKR